MQEDTLRALLEAYDIPLEKWGKDGAKTFKNLLEEIEANEAVISTRNFCVIRTISTVTIRVYYVEKGRQLILVEEKQVFKDGRVRKREKRSSISEKIRFGERPETAAKRAFQEELGIWSKENLVLIPQPISNEKAYPSVSFPGLYTQNLLCPFDVFLPEELYQPEGYVERQRDKETYFVWKPLHSTAP